jgi:hypothetical protein
MSMTRLPKLRVNLGAVALASTLALAGCGQVVQGRVSGARGGHATSGALTPVKPPAPASTVPPPGASVQRVAVVGPNAAWAVVGDSSASEGRPVPPELDYTDDGGQSWRHVTTLAAAAARAGSGPLWQYNAPDFFFGSSDAWIGLDTAGQSSDVAVVRTSDGGSTWNGSRLPTSASVLPGARAPVLGQLRFWDASHGWAVVDSSPGTCDTGDGYLFATSDGGSSWQVVGATPAPCGEAFFLNATDGWFQRSGFSIGGASARWLWFTTDRGRSWSPATVDLTSCRKQPFLGGHTLVTSAGADAVFLENGSAGCDGFMVTSDGGETWNLVAFPFSNGDIGTVLTVNDWFVIDPPRGEAAATSDAGRHWQIYKMGSSVPAGALVADGLQAATPSQLWFLADNSRIYLSNNDGRSLTNVTPRG